MGSKDTTHSLQDISKICVFITEGKCGHDLPYLVIMVIFMNTFFGLIPRHADKGTCPTGGNETGLTMTCTEIRS